VMDASNFSIPSPGMDICSGRLSSPLPLDLSNSRTPSTSPSFFGMSMSSMQDTDDREILPHRLPPLPEHSFDDMDVVHPVDSPTQVVPIIPLRTVWLMLPSHIHPAFPGCTPSTPGTSQQMPQVSCRLLVKHFAKTCYRNFPAIPRR
jgi:hypothetical protein